MTDYDYYLCERGHIAVEDPLDREQAIAWPGVCPVTTAVRDDHGDVSHLLCGALYLRQVEPPPKADLPPPTN